MRYLNIYTEKQFLPHPWILQRAANEIKRAYPETTINGKPREVNYFVNYALYGAVDGINVGHFTHLEDGETHPFRKLFLDLVSKYDYYTVLCAKTFEILAEHVEDPRRIFVIPYGCDERLIKKPIFGIVGSVKASGRKGEHLVKKMVEAGFDVRAWGYGWPVEKLSHDWDDLPRFYQQIDYLVVTSTNEGGPVPVIDAIGAAVPIIAPDVGWCWEYPVIRYKRGNWQDLKKVLTSLSNPPTWIQWADRHHEMFEEICSQS